MVVKSRFESYDVVCSLIYMFISNGYFGEEYFGSREAPLVNGARRAALPEDRPVGPETLQGRII